jgi:hypothetical protein
VAKVLGIIGSPLDPLPVTRFNLDRVLARAGSLGQRLAEQVSRPYAGVWEQMLTYDDLPYVGYGRIDEFRWLAEQIAEGLEARGEQAKLREIRRLLDEGKACASSGDQACAAQRYVEAYQTGRQAW